VRLVAKSEAGENDQPAHLGVVERFTAIRTRLIFFFEKRGCVDPEELADTTLERVVENLASQKVTDLEPYSFGVAKNVFLEYLRKKKKTVAFLDEQKYRSQSTSGGGEDEAIIRERKLTCMEECLARLKEHERAMLLEYYEFNGRLKLERRRKMAEQMNISKETLALRIFHLKKRLRKCVTERLEDF
jgi:RNA polymerase sigma factor (sigma-70 family)